MPPRYSVKVTCVMFLAGIRDRALNYTGTDTQGLESLILYVRAASLRPIL